MTKVSDITKYIESLFPLDTAEGFDNPGLLVSTDDRIVSRVIVCLDTTMAVVNTARELNAEMIFSHHPLIFGGIKSVNYSDPKGNIIVQLIRSGISCYAAHTNLDASDKYSNNLLALKLGADSSSIHGADEVFCGVVGELPSTVTLKEFCENASRALNASGVITYRLPETKVRRIFAQGGSFDENSIPFVVASGVDTVVSGEIKHHIMLELEELGITGVIAGHNATERIFMENICGNLESAFPQVEFVYFDGSERKF